MAIGLAMSLAQDANRYLNDKAPWKTLKEDRDSTATVLWVALSVIGCLKVVLSPFLPFSSARLHEMMGFPGGDREGGWSWSPTKELLPPGQRLAKPAPLYIKLDEAVAEQETARLGTEAI
jgi:methionyl-tRNA synthetase